MKREIRNSEKKESFFNTMKFAIIVSIFIAVFAYIGFAQVAYDLNVTGSVALNSQRGVVIANVTEAATSSSSIETAVKNYVNTLATNYIKLDSNGSSYAIMAIQVQNTTTSDYGFIRVSPDVSTLSDNLSTYTNRYIVPQILTPAEAAQEISGVSSSSVIGIGDILPAQSSKTIYVKFKYDPSIINNGTVSSSNTILETGMLNYIFKEAYAINYSNVSGDKSVGYANEQLVINLTGTFASLTITDSSNNTLVSGTDYTLSNNVLTFTNGINSNITITAATSSIYVDNTTTTYDPANVPPNSTVTYQQVPGSPKVTTDANGNIISFEYLDHTGVALTSTSSNIDTGVLAFEANQGFTIHMVVTMNPSSNDNKKMYLLSAMKKLTKQNKYAGFVFYDYDGTYFYLNGSTSGTYNNNFFGSRINSSGWKTNGANNTYTLDIIYTPNPNKSISCTFSPVASGYNSSFYTNSTNLSYIPDDLEGATITIGGNGFDNTKNMKNATVLEFKVEKT